MAIYQLFVVTQPNETTLAALKESEDIRNGVIPAKSYSSAAELIREAQEEIDAENQANLPI